MWPDFLGNQTDWTPICMEYKMEDERTVKHEKSPVSINHFTFTFSGISGAPTPGLDEEIANLAGAEIDRVLETYW